MENKILYYFFYDKSTRKISKDKIKTKVADSNIFVFSKINTIVCEKSELDRIMESEQSCIMFSFSDSLEMFVDKIVDSFETKIINLSLEIKSIESDIKRLKFYNNCNKRSNNE